MFCLKKTSSINIRLSNKIVDLSPKTTSTEDLVKDITGKGDFMVTI